MNTSRFEDLICWQKRKILSLEIYKVFRNLKDLSFRNQIERASVSILNNIAEGFERQTNKEFKQFLYIAKGSAGEVRSMLLLAEELEYITTQETRRLVVMAEEVSKLLAGMIKNLPRL